MAVTGSKAPLPTMIDEGVHDEDGKIVERLPAAEVRWEPAPESAYHSEVRGGLSVIMLNEFAKEVESNEPPWVGFQCANDWNAGCGDGAPP